MKNLLLAAVCLAALVSPKPAAAYPDAAAQSAVPLKGVTWTLMPDSRDPELWYYLPAAPRLVETGGRPNLFLLRYQAPSAADKAQLQDNALLQLTLSAEPTPAEALELKKAAAALRPGLKNIRLVCVPLASAVATVSGEAGGTAFFGPAEDLFYPGPRAGQLVFRLAAASEAAAELERLVLRGEALKVTLDYSYAAGPAKFSSASVSGSLALSSYREDLRKQAVLVIPSGSWDYALVRLPQIPADTAVTQVSYTVRIMHPKLSTPPMQSVVWNPDSAAAAPQPGWRDSRKNPVNLLLIPVKALYDQAAKLRIAMDEVKLRIDADVVLNQGSGSRTIKGAGEFPLLTEGLPLAGPYSPFKTLVVNADYLTFDGTKDTPGLLDVKTLFSCGDQKWAAVFRQDKEGKLTAVTAPAFFAADCGKASVQATYTLRDGSKVLTQKKDYAEPFKDGSRLILLEDSRD